LSGDSYGRIAALYDPATRFFLDPVRRLIGQVLLQLGATRVLDVCCGTGRQTRVLRRIGLHSVGIDASPAMLAVAGRRIDGNATPFGRMDARCLAFADATFDAAVISLALHENDESDRLAIGRDMLRVVRPGGHLLVADYAAPPAPSFLGALVPLAEWLAGVAHYRHYRDFQLKKGVAGIARRLGCEVAATHPCLGGQAAVLVLPVGSGTAAQSVASQPVWR